MKLTENLIISSFNNLELTVNNYASYCMKLVNSPNKESMHHVFPSVVFSGMDDYIVYCSKQEHTRLHLILVQDIYDKVLKCDINANKLALGLTARERLAGSLYNDILEVFFSEDYDEYNKLDIKRLVNINNNIIYKDKIYNNHLESFKNENYIKKLSDSARLHNSDLYDKKCAFCGYIVKKVSRFCKTRPNCKRSNARGGEKVMYSMTRYNANGDVIGYYGDWN